MNSNDNDNKVMAFGDLRQADSISVKTERSDYRFSILDPISRRGMLTGGVLGDQLREAVLIGAISEDGALYNTTQLKTGWHAVFFVTTDGCLNHMITSAITDFAHIRGAVEGKRAA